MYKCIMRLSIINSLIFYNHVSQSLLKAHHASVYANIIYPKKLRYSAPVIMPRPSAVWDKATSTLSHRISYSNGGECHVVLRPVRVYIAL